MKECTIEKTCIVCGTTHTITAKDDRDLELWDDGMHIQQALPYLTADERELLVSGVCGSCFDKMCPAEPDQKLTLQQFAEYLGCTYEEVYDDKIEFITVTNNGETLTAVHFDGTERILD